MEPFGLNPVSLRRSGIPGGLPANAGATGAKIGASRLLLSLLLLFSAAGCSFLLPTELSTTKQPWESFAEADQAFDQIIPEQTSVKDLEQLGFDPFTSPNIKVLTYLDLMVRLMPHDGFHKSDVHEAVQRCFEARDDCRAFELIVEVKKAKRIGNVLLDLFGFKKTTHVTGWYFDALVIVQDDVVVYKIRSGEPKMDRTDQKIKPLGPLQELDALVVPAAEKTL